MPGADRRLVPEVDLTGVTDRPSPSGQSSRSPGGRSRSRSRSRTGTRSRTGSLDSEEESWNNWWPSDYDPELDFECPRFPQCIRRQTTRIQAVNGKSGTKWTIACPQCGSSLLFEHVGTYISPGPSPEQLALQRNIPREPREPRSSDLYYTHPSIRLI